MNMTSPRANDRFQITSDPTWPSIAFQTDSTSAHLWKWKISWKTFSRSGTANTPDNKWNAQSVITDLGGTLTVDAVAGGQTASVTVKVTGQSPSVQQVSGLPAMQPNSDGFDKLLDHQSHGTHFDGQGEPVKSFDGGYGMAQLTSPVPSYEQVWNWKKNVDGADPFRPECTPRRSLISRKAAVPTRLFKLSNESVCRWNGGSYHVWNTTTNAWVRDPDILCDSGTGNIGWDMTDSENTSKTEAQLHARDRDAYSHRRNQCALEIFWRVLCRRRFGLSTLSCCLFVRPHGRANTERVSSCKPFPPSPEIGTKGRPVVVTRCIVPRSR